MTIFNFFRKTYAQKTELEQKLRESELETLCIIKCVKELCPDKADEIAKRSQAMLDIVISNNESSRRMTNPIKARNRSIKITNTVKAYDWRKHDRS